MFYRTVACKAAPHFTASTPDRNYYPQFSAKAWLSIADLATKIIDNELAAWMLLLVRSIPCGCHVIGNQSLCHMSELSGFFTFLCNLLVVKLYSYDDTESPSQ
jgi:hypothetical protein